MVFSHEPAEPLIDYNVGAIPITFYEIKKMDFDYFIEDNGEQIWLGFCEDRITIKCERKMDDWCDQKDEVSDGDRIYRCSKCGKRLHPRRMFGDDGEVIGWILPPYKKKGHKIKAKRKHQRKT